MFFTLLGVGFTVAFFKVLFHGHRHHRGGGPRWRRGLDVAFERLDTSPGQEKEIRRAVSSFFDDVMPAKRELRRSLKETVLVAIQSEEFSDEALRAELSEQEARILGVRESMVAMLGRVHAALDAEQRERLGAWLGRRMHAPARGPYR